jgi:hypothetical protein
MAPGCTRMALLMHGALLGVQHCCLLSNMVSLCMHHVRDAIPAAPVYCTLHNVLLHNVLLYYCHYTSCCAAHLLPQSRALHHRQSRGCRLNTRVCTMSERTSQPRLSTARYTVQHNMLRCSPPPPKPRPPPPPKPLPPPPPNPRLLPPSPLEP